MSCLLTMRSRCRSITITGPACATRSAAQSALLLLGSLSPRAHVVCSTVWSAARERSCLFAASKNSECWWGSACVVGQGAWLGVRVEVRFVGQMTGFCFLASSEGHLAQRNVCIVAQACPRVVPCAFCSTTSLAASFAIAVALGCEHKKP
jgi:hypothetical protein